MNAIKGTYSEGRVVLSRPANWPDGTHVIVEPLSHQRSLGIREEDWPTDAEGTARLLATMDQVEPLEMTAEEEADLAEWRKKIKAYTIKNMQKRIEGLFE